MLRGRFGGTSKRPYLEGRLYIPRLSLWSEISFLVDTGADSTVLMPADGAKMGIDYSALTKSRVPAVGIGGQSYNYTEEAWVVFSDPDQALYCYHVDLDILNPIPELMDAPSLLGRVVLNQWVMHYSPSDGVLTFDVVTADRIISVPPSSQDLS